MRRIASEYGIPSSTLERRVNRKVLGNSHASGPTDRYVAVASMNTDDLLAITVTGNALSNESSSDKDAEAYYRYCCKSRNIVPKTANYAEITMPML